MRRLAAQGYGEVVLTGVDITSWGSDLPGLPTLGQLAARILKLVPELPRLRLSSIDAAEIDPDLMRCLTEEPRLMPHLHLSLQAGDDMILKRMKRRHSRADALRLIAQVRAVRPETAFGADLIAGFPTETEAMFENTLRLVEDAGLAFLHVFPFSPRPGTPAARMPQLDRAVVKARAERLRRAGEAALRRHLDHQVGRTVRALVERKGLARAEDFTEVAFEGAGEPGAGQAFAFDEGADRPADLMVQVAALRRHLDHQVGRTVRALVERKGLARAEDFTEVAFEGAGEPGAVVRLAITGHDGRRALAIKAPPVPAEP